MLVRAGLDHAWLPLHPIEGLPEGGLRALCGPDAAGMLEADSPLPVVAFGPWPEGAIAGVDAVCLTADGGIELLVSTFGESPRDTLWRLLDVAGALRGTELDAFAHHCTELGSEASVARWLQQRVGGDEHALEQRLATTLDSGDFGFLLVTSRGAQELAQPLAFLQAGGARVRVFELEVLTAGDVQAVEGTEVALDGTSARPTASAPAELRLVEEPEAEAAPEPEAEAAPEPEADVVPEPEAEAAPEPEADVVPEPEADVVPEPEADVVPEPEAEAAPEPEADVVPEPEAEAAPEPAAELVLEPSNASAFLTALDQLDHRASNHLRWLHNSLLHLVDEAEYTTDGELEHVAGWCHGTARVPLFGLDSQGLLQLVISTLPAEEQLEFAKEVAGLLPEGDGDAFVEAGYAEVDVPAHMDDQTLLEYLVDNLVEALPGGRQAFGTTRGDEAPVAGTGDDAGTAPEQPASELEPEPAATDVAPAEDEHSIGEDDFFAGMSTGHDPEDVRSALESNGFTAPAEPAFESPEPASSEPAKTEADAQEPAAAAQESEAAPRQSRWLRRRAA